MELLLHNEFVNLVVLGNAVLHFSLLFFYLGNHLGVEVLHVLFELLLDFFVVHDLHFKPLHQLQVFIFQLDYLLAPVEPFFFVVLRFGL